ncbi:MAG: PEP-CTERM sorting domain-containing protein, partial [Cyanobacteria bacterium J06559_3]
EIISYAYDYEQATLFRRPPALVPPLPGETIEYEAVPEPTTGVPMLAALSLGMLGYRLKQQRNMSSAS